MPEELLTVAQIARRLDIPADRLLRMVKQGALVPDAVCSRAILFKQASIERVENALAQLGISITARATGGRNVAAMSAAAARR